MSDAAGIPFGSYRLIRRIALGGMAEVFLARQTGLEGFDRLCAIKRILPHLVASREFVDMFQGEARLAAQLRHPNVVHIYEFGKVDDHYFIAMEYVDGVAAGSLIQHAASEPLPFALVARIGASACAGLDHAHNLRDVEGNPLALVHRDVSPPNLLFSYEGAIKLVDFGIAKAENSIESTRPGVVKGKYAYMSPEQTVGDVLDGRSDVFSLGVVLWELLAGRPAVRRDDPIEGMKAIRDGRIPPIESVRPETPTSLVRALGAALATDKDRRVSALELGLALERFIKQSSGIMSSNLEIAQWLRTRFPRTDTALPDVRGPTRQAAAATSVAASAPQMAAERTEISPPLFPDGSPLSGPTEMAAEVQLRPKARGPLIVVAAVGLAMAAALTLFLVGRASSSENRAAAPEAIDAEPAAVELATLNVIAKPAGTSVRVGDRLLDGPSAIPPGPVEITVSKDGYVPETRSVDLAAGELRTIELTLTQAKKIEPTPDKTGPKVKTVKKATKPQKGKGRLRARSIPYADVYLRGKKLGQTPFETSLPVGKHRLRFRNKKAGIDVWRTVKIERDKTARVLVKEK